MPELLARDSTGYDPADQAQVISALESSGQRSLTQLQKATGTSRPRIFEAVSDLSRANLVTISRSNSTVEVKTHQPALSKAHPPVIPPKRVVFANLPGKYQGEQRGERPAVVVSDYNCNAMRAVNVVPLTSNCDKPPEGTAKVNATKENSLDADSLALCHNLKTVSKGQILTVFGTVDEQYSRIQRELKDILAV